MVPCRGRSRAHVIALLVVGLICTSFVVGLIYISASQRREGTTHPQPPLISSVVGELTSLPVAPLQDFEQLSPAGFDPRIAVDGQGRVYCAWESKTSDYDCLLHVRVRHEQHVWTFAWPALCELKDHFFVFDGTGPFRVIEVTYPRELQTFGSWGGTLNMYDVNPPPSTPPPTATGPAPSASYPWSISLPPRDFGDILQLRIWDILAVPGHPGRYLLVGKYDEWEGSIALRSLTLLLGSHPRSFGKCCSAILDTTSARTTNVLPVAKKGPLHAEPLAACVDPQGVAHVALIMRQPDEFPGKVSLATLRPEGWVRCELEADVFSSPLMAEGGGNAFLAWNNKGRCYLAPLGPDGPGPGTEVSVGMLQALGVSQSGEPYLLWTDSYGEDARLAVFPGQKPRAGAYLTRLERVEKAAMSVDAHNDVHLLWSEYELGKSTSFYPIYYARVELPSAPAAP